MFRTIRLLLKSKFERMILKEKLRAKIILWLLNGNKMVANMKVENPEIKDLSNCIIIGMNVYYNKPLNHSVVSNFNNSIVIGINGFYIKSKDKGNK
jgi:hypothetical protein